MTGRDGGTDPDPVPGRRLPPGYRAAPVGAAAAPRDAATVVLLRDGPAAVEAYLLRRPATMAFAGGMYVFPGGSVDRRDLALPPGVWCGPPAAEWGRPLSAPPELAAALVAAAVRETFEESGVLLAGPDPDTVLADLEGPQWAEDRRAVLAGALGIGELLAARGLLLRSDLLRAWAHWVTPESEPRRFDTRFFVAAAPAGQRVAPLPGESDDGRWIGCREALRAHADGQLNLLPPTAFTLAELAGHASVADVLAAGARRDIRPVLPRVVLTDDAEAVLLLPGEPGYAP